MKLFHPALYQGFTLIELSIVLVIIGLIVGGVLVGRDLIGAAEVRAQVSQIESYNTAMNTFRLKFNTLPGDMDNTIATQFGFEPHLAAPTVSMTPMNGLLEGTGYLDPSHIYNQGGGEVSQFWGDMSSAPGGRLIAGNFSATATAAAVCYAGLVQANIAKCLPAAKIGNGNYVYVYSSGGYNWYAMGKAFAYDPGDNIPPYVAGLTVMQAYNIDKKTDDGLPATGNVLAVIATDFGPVPAEHDTAAATDCYISGAYNIATSNSRNVNCSLSFKFQ